ncbi:MAG: DUF3800 domain-containing protein [Acidobacteria bacterium]|nr:DUF3800 domain-containing protein [Acidobacteriota bacterium]
MYACYVDESGHCGERFNADQPVEVVCGVITDVTKLFKTQRDHGEILSFLDKNGISISELKSKDIYRGKDAWRKIPADIRHSILDLLLSWAEERTCKFIVCPIDSKSFFDRKAGGCPVTNHLQFPYEAGALNVVLAVERLKSGTAKNKGKTFIIFDEQHKHDDRVVSLIDSDLSFTDGYTGYTAPKRKTAPPRLGEVIDIPFFSKSHLSTLIQLADLAAYVVNRYLLLTVYGRPESYSGEIIQITKWYTTIQKNAIGHTHINPPTKDELCDFYREIRPAGWTPKAWFVNT